MWNFVFLPEDRSRVRVFLMGHRIDQVALECRKRAHSNGNGKVLALFLSDQKNGGHLGPFPCSFFPQSQQIKIFEITILFRIVESHNNYVFGDDLLPHSPWVRGCKLQTFTSVYISIGYWEVYRHFQGDFIGLGVGLEGGYVGGSFLGGICHGGREIEWERADYLVLL